MFSFLFKISSTQNEIANVRNLWPQLKAFNLLRKHNVNKKSKRIFSELKPLSTCKYDSFSLVDGKTLTIFHFIDREY